MINPLPYFPGLIMSPISFKYCMSWTFRYLPFLPPCLVSMVAEEPMTKDIEMKSEESRHPNQKLKYHTPRRIREAAKPNLYNTVCPQ